MGRPLWKINKKSIKFIVDNSGKMSYVEMAKHLGVHHTTVLYWKDKLAKRGIKVESRFIGEGDKLLDEIYGKFVSRKKSLRMDSGVRTENE